MATAADSILKITSEVLKTDVDRFIDFVRKNKRVSVSEAAKSLNIDQKVIQKWVDFLVEERVLGVEYNFTTPYVFLNEEKNVNDSAQIKDKELFYEKARERGLDENEIKRLWRKYLDLNKLTIKAAFIKKTKEKGINDEKAKLLWIKYYNYLIS